MKRIDCFFLKCMVPVPFALCSLSVSSALNVEGFSLSEQDKILSVYGSCHRMEEPLTVILSTNTDKVVIGGGWQMEFTYKLNEEKKYKTEFFSADHDKLSNAEGDENILRGGPGVVNIGPSESAVAYSEGKRRYVLNLPTRNISYLSIRIISKTNKNGGYFIWSERNGNYLSGGWQAEPAQFAAFKGQFSGRTDGQFNLLSVDHLQIDFAQTMGGVGFKPRWEFTAHEMDFQDRGPYTAEQYRAACK